MQIKIYSIKTARIIGINFKFLNSFTAHLPKFYFLPNKGVVKKKFREKDVVSYFLF